MSRPASTPDTALILAAQAVRAFCYGLGAVLLGATLEERGFSTGEAGLLLAGVLAGTVLSSLLVGRYGDAWGRRRCYRALYLALGVTGVAFAFADTLWVLIPVALTGALSTEVVESGPFTSLEQAMLATDLSGRARLRGFGTYNAVATAAGSLGALGAGGLGPLRDVWSNAPADERAFLVFVPVSLAGALLANLLSPGVEAVRAPGEARRPLGASRPRVLRLSVLFATDSFGGGFVVQSFIAYWLTVRFGATVGSLGVVFFAVGLLQTASMLVAPRLAERHGLLPTMVFTHLPSNVLLAALAFAPTFGVAVALLLARVALSQMDVPTRQAYVMALVEPSERTAAAAYTNTARYLVRPIGPALAGASQSIALGAPFLIAGVVKGAYDLVLWRWFRTVDLPAEAGADERPAVVSRPDEEVL
ncbi:MAG: MFS transporter [Acidimicrobiia bacterium]